MTDVQGLTGFRISTFFIYIWCGLSRARYEVALVFHGIHLVHLPGSCLDLLVYLLNTDGIRWFLQAAPSVSSPWGLLTLCVGDIHHG